MKKINTQEYKVSKEDKELFRQTVSKISEKVVHQTKIQYNYNKAYDHKYEEVDAETVISFAKPHLPVKVLDNLKRGSIKFNAILDLHGLNTIQAATAVSDFINQSLTEHQKYALIIHGKGSIYGEKPILKNFVYNFLLEIKEVLAIQSAAKNHGGNGALYVLLKTNL
jgi:DNA-nicking Smr family endonuclease